MIRTFARHRQNDIYINETQISFCSFLKKITPLLQSKRKVI